jgi:hypothetical protein
VRWSRKSFPGAPRYSRPVQWSRKSFPGTPRYSRPVQWSQRNFPGTPRYSSFKDRFVVHERYKRQTRPYSYGIAGYQGSVKLKKPKHKHMHPSVHHLTAEGVANPTVRKGLKKWRRFWLRLNPNNENPYRRRKLAKKPKFDRNERHIWNDNREKKPTTRDPNTPDSGEAEAEQE